MVSRNDLLPGTVISSSRIFRAVSLGTCLRITSRTRSTVLLLAATRHLLQHPQGHRPFTGRASRAPRTLYGRPYSTRGALRNLQQVDHDRVAVPARARVRCGPREQRERERGDELEHFYHKSQQLGSAHSIFSKTRGHAAAISSAKPPSPKSSSQRTPRCREGDSNFQYASTVRWHRAADLPLPPTVKRRSGAPASHGET